MTYRREAGGWHAAWTETARAVGRERLAELLEVTPSRVDQLRNPLRRDNEVLERAVRADVASARAGLGCPLYEAYGRKLAEAGVAPEAAARTRHLERAAVACLGLLKRMTALLEAALGPAAVPAGEAG
ncbi:hypothetical protein [Ferruginivarius sediminum]|uniref:Uncharacterized protein n=1 Tax=Ferruginivarius sediminum TaxID=2661937 RepID=A0A369T6F3_9PROT|nr:hypothetical protein [Ferruginivarius sediminum]RDD60472.1 hypothetical protein DRB17_17890 [Ferruginivarius sediminum]